MSIQTNLQEVLNELPPGVKLVAVSKFQSNEAITEAYKAGQRIFGESRARELKAKHEVLPKDIEWHFIGTLQSNKIKYIIPYISLIHGIDSYNLLEEVNKQAFKAGRIVDCLLQLHIAREETKFGFSFDECRKILDGQQWKTLSNIQICGVMGMATNTDDRKQIMEEFRSLKEFFDEIKRKHFATKQSFRELSMGMSNDYKLAIDEGSTMVRIGSKIFQNLKTKELKN